MADLILGSTTAISESGGTVTLDNAVQDNITRLGTVTSGNIDAVSDVILLYSHLASGATSISVDGYFDDTKYGYYRMHFFDTTVDTADLQPYLRCNTGGSANSGSHYSSAIGENFWSSGNVGTADRADNDDGTFLNVDGTWNIPRSDGSASVRATQDITLEFSSPQSTTTWKNLRMHSVSGASEDSPNYHMVSTGIGLFQSYTAVTGITLLTSGSVNISSKVLLYGFRK